MISEETNAKNAEEVGNALTGDQILEILTEYDSTQPSSTGSAYKKRADGQYEYFEWHEDEHGEILTEDKLRTVLVELIKSGDYEEHYKWLGEPLPHLKYLKA